MNLRYRLATWLLGYAPIRDPDYEPAYRRVRNPGSWLLIRSPGATSSTHAWLKIERFEVNMESQSDLSRFGAQKTYVPSQRHGTFHGTLAR